MKRQIPVAAVVALALLIVAVVGYVVLIRPKRAEAGRLDAEVAALDTKVAAARAARAAGGPETAIEVADLFRLSKAMPDADDMPGVILELNSVAAAAGVRFVSIAPAAPIVATGYRQLPIGLVFEGNYYDLTDFLFRLRNLVSVRDGELEATGRFFTLDSLDLHEGPDGFPEIQASLTVSAYVFVGGGAAAAPGAPPVAGTTTAPATTTTTEEAPEDAQDAAGGTG